MQFASWILLAGLVLVAIALIGSLIKKLPVSTSLLYLVIGFVVAKLGLQTLDAFTYQSLFHRISEVAVVVSVFSAGLNMRSTVRLGRWGLPLRLAVICMIFTVAAVAFAGVWGLGLPLGAAILLGGALAPTDPVLASDVQVEHPSDSDRLRAGLTGEAGLNDGTAWPAVLLGIALLQRAPGEGVGDLLLRWFAIDALWAVFAGVALGLLFGGLVGRLVIHLRTKHQEGVGRDDFLALGLMALSYAVAVQLHASGFLAVFAAGVALRKIELKASERLAMLPPGDVKQAANEEQTKEGEAPPAETHPHKAHAYMTDAVLGFNEKLERLAEGLIILLVGILLADIAPHPALLWFIPLLFFVVRPLAIWLGLVGSSTSKLQRTLMGWFGIRGVASVYYVFFAMSHGLYRPLASTLLSIVIPVIAASILLHGISVTPLMKAYEKRKGPQDDRSKWTGPRREADAQVPVPNIRA